MPIDAPALERGRVRPIEREEVLLGERRRRAQLAGAERGQRATDALEVGLDRRKAALERQRRSEPRPHDLEAGFGGDASGILEHGLDEAIVAVSENGQLRHFELLPGNQSLFRRSCSIDVACKESEDFGILDEPQTVERFAQVVDADVPVRSG